MKLNYLEAGHGRPLVIMHGLMGSSRNWGAIIRQLGECRRVLALDLPNHGGSPWAEVMDYPFMARTVAQFIEDLGSGPATVIGHSMGGKAAMALALTRPELVEKLVVVDIAPVGYTHTFAPYIKAMRAVPLGTIQRRSEVDEHLKAAIPDPRIRAFLMQNLDGEPGAYRWRPNLAVLGAAMSDILDFPSFSDSARYEGPTLFLAGADSDYVKPEFEPKISSLFPHARIERIAGAGHWLHADKPEAFVKVVGEFIGD